MALDPSPKMTRRRVFGFTLEANTGTPVVPVAADCVTRVFDPDVKYSTEKVERQATGTAFSPIVQYMGARSASASFETELVGNGATGAPVWTRLLQGCGMQVTAGVWTPLSNASQTLTIAEWRDGKRYLMFGAMGSFKLVCHRGQKARLKWDFKGIPMPIIDVADPAPTYISTIAPRIATAFTVGGTTLRVPDIEYDIGNKVELREDMTGVDASTPAQSTGYRTAYIMDREPSAKISPEALSVATQDWFTSQQSLTTFALVHTIGNAANNTFSITAPAMQIVDDPTAGDRNGLQTDELSFLLTRGTPAGDDEFSMALS